MGISLPTIIGKIAVVTLAIQMISATTANGKEHLMVIGTAAKTGLFFPIGSEICTIINKKTLTTGLRCMAAVTGGSEYNLMALRTGEIEFAITQSNTACDAFDGRGNFEAYGPNSSLRYLGRLYSTPITVVTTEGNSGSLDNLKGKRISLGIRGSGKRAIAQQIIKAAGWTAADAARATEIDLTDDKVADAFCKGEIDGFVQIMGMPSPLYDRALTACHGRIVQMQSGLIESLVRANSYLHETTIPPGPYNPGTSGIVTPAVDTILVTTSRVSGESVNELLSTTRDHLETLKTLIPALTESALGGMDTTVHPIPRHEFLSQ